MTARPPHENGAPLEKRRGFRLSISRTLTLGLTFLFLASLGTSLWVAFDAAQQNTLQLQRELSELTVEAAIREVDTHLGAAQDQAEFLGALLERGDVDIDDEQRLTDLLVGALAAAPQVSGIALVRADYSVLRAGRAGDELFSLKGNWADREDIRAAMSDPSSLQGSTWRTIVWIEDFQAPHVVVAEPLFRDKQFLGAVFSVASISALSGFLADFDRANQTHSFILYGRETVLAHPLLADGYSGFSEDGPLPALAEVNDEVLAAIWGEVIDDLAYMLDDSRVSSHVVRGHDDDYIFLYRELDNYGELPWIVGVYFLGSEINLPIRRLFFAAAIGVAILLLAIVSGLVLARSIVRPLQRLAGASRSVRRLELDKVPPCEAACSASWTSPSRPSTPCWLA